LSTAIVLVVLDLLGLAAIWFYVRYRLRRALELDTLVEELRKEVRALNIELNETTERNISLVEDRMEALRGLLDEADRRMGVVRKELDKGSREREVYTRLGRLQSQEQPQSGPRPGMQARLEFSAGPSFSGKPAMEDSIEIGQAWDAASVIQAEPIRLPLGKREARDSGEREESAQAPEAAPPDEGPARITVARESVIPRKSTREEAAELYSRGFSSELIAARLGITVAEADLLVSLEERRRGRND
jgi:hypothetical protein